MLRAGVCNIISKEKNIRIYIANLRAYNEGILKGAWFDLPVEWEDIVQKVFDKNDLDESGNPKYDWQIHDYEAPFHIDENFHLEELNEIAEMFDRLTDRELEVVLALYDLGIIHNILDGEYELDYCIYHENCEDMTDVAHNYIDNNYDQEQYEFFLRYFDYEAYGNHLYSNGTFINISNAIIEYTK